MKNKQIWNYVIDAILLAGFLVAFFLDLTGLDGHQWLGVGVAVFSGYHLILHWNWVKGVTQKLFSQISGQAKAYYGLDAILLVGLALISVTGLAISTWLGLELVNYVVWLDLHILISVATLIALVLKIGLHWKWIVKTTQRILRVPVPAVPSKARQTGMQPALAAVDVSRREFISLMGVVGVASVLAAANGMNGLTRVQAEATSTSQSVAGSAAPATSSSSGSASLPSTSTSSSTTTSACVIRCNKRCSYPGRCRRYVDSNGNKKCDLGECL